MDQETKSVAAAVHSAFLAAFPSVSAADVPLLRLSLSTGFHAS